MLIHQLFNLITTMLKLIVDGQQSFEFHVISSIAQRYYKVYA